MSRRGWIALLLLAGGSLLVATAVWLLLRTGAAESGQVPSGLAGLELTGQIDGPQAVTTIQDLHGVAFGMTDGIVARYGDGQATLWIAVLPTDHQAEDLLLRMDRRIAEGRSPFSGAGLDGSSDRQVRSLSGLGQSHFYFQSGTRVVWLAVEPTLAGRVLEEALVFFP